MLLAADWGTGQVLWLLLWCFLLIVWIGLIFIVFGDLTRNDDTTGHAKALWSAMIVFIPFLGVFAYLVVHGDSMNARQSGKSATGRSPVREGEDLAVAEGADEHCTG